jgi:hypothetical protein
MKTITIALLLLIVIIFAGCKDDTGNTDVICTEEFVVIGVKITGAAPDDFFTVRTANMDTIRFDGDFPVGNWYPVLDDSFQPQLQDQREEFYFVAVAANEVIINQRYEIGADKCHVIRYTGPSEITVD